MKCLYKISSDFSAFVSANVSDPTGPPGGTICKCAAAFQKTLCLIFQNILLGGTFCNARHDLIP